MPTRNRGHFVAQSVRYFQRQDWEHRELIIIDDGGEDRSSDFCRNKRIRYVHKSEPLTIGAKRNLACELAQGSIIAHWDDDDWYSADRLSIQAAPLVQELGEVSAFSDCIFCELPKWRFWKCSSLVFSRMFVGDAHAGTLVFRRELFESGMRYPNSSLAEDALFLYMSHRAGARLCRLSAEGKFIYFRHSRSAWQFACGEYIDPRGWCRIGEPDIPAEDRIFLKAQWGILKEAK